MINLELGKAILEEMLEEQVAQGNPRDYTVFYDNLDAGRDAGGFDHDNAEEGASYWNDYLTNGITRKYIYAALLEMDLENKTPPTETHIIDNQTYIV